MAMEYIEGEDLGKQITEKGALPEAEALLYIRQISDALTLVHEKGLLHRDLKPSNIMMRAGKPEAVLIDFGIARQFIPGGVLQHTENLTPGYAPPEQYVPDAERGEYIDIYALAATLYSLLTGQLPMPAPARLQNFTMRSPKDLNGSVSDRVNQAIMKGMALNYKFRPQSVQEWLDLLDVNLSGTLMLPIQTAIPIPHSLNPIPLGSQHWECIQTITNYANNASFQFSPNGQMLATTDTEESGYVTKLWEVSTGKNIRSISYGKEFQHDSFIDITAFSREHLILASYRGNVLKLWYISSRWWQQIKTQTIYFPTLEPFDTRFSSLALSPDGKMLVSSIYSNNGNLPNRTIKQWYLGLITQVY